MKWSVFAFSLMAGISICGCASHKPKAPKPAAAAPAVIVTPDTSLAASVVLYNPTGRFVVLSFPVGKLPGMGQNFFLYRGGLKAGEVRITGPQRDNYVVADVVAGNAQIGDEVREQ